MDDSHSLNWLYHNPLMRHFTSNKLIDYFIYGNNPRLFISSGMHGDEYKVVSSVSKSLKMYLNKMPSFIYVPIAAPSAVKNKTRVNESGQDVNRGFMEISTTEESKAIMEIIQRCKFDFAVSFHEDPQFSDFYMYDDQIGQISQDIVNLYDAFKQKLQKMNIGLYSGMDDGKDPSLDHMIVNAYKALIFDPSQKENGQLESWMIRRNVCARILTPEFPKNLEQALKDKVVDLFITDVVIPLF